MNTVSRLSPALFSLTLLFLALFFFTALSFLFPIMAGSAESGYVLEDGFFEDDGEGEAIDADDARQKLDVDLGKAIRFRDFGKIGLLLDVGADLNFSPIPQEKHPCKPGLPVLSCTMCCVFQAPDAYSTLPDPIGDPKNVEVLALLLRKGMNLNARCFTNGGILERVLQGSSKQKKEMLSLLIDYGLTIDSEVVHRCLDHDSEQHKQCPPTCLKAQENCKELEKLIEDKVREREEKVFCLGEVRNFLPVSELVNIVGEYAYQYGAREQSKHAPEQAQQQAGQRLEREQKEEEQIWV